MDTPYRNNSDRVLPVTLDPDAPDRDAALLALARALVPSWAGATACTVAQVHGGITNLLFRLRSDGLEPLLVRVYGANTERVIDREAENRLFADLSRRGFAPTYHGRFTNGRVEGWLEGSRALEPGELGQPALRRLIAAELRILHGLPAPAGGSRLWQTLEGWLETARTLDFSGAQETARAALGLDRYSLILKRLRSAERWLAKSNAARTGWRLAFRSVLSHNDLLAGNILINRTQDRVRFIDYEYGGVAPAAFDVANHFCEYAGFDSDFDAGFPSRADRDDFIAHYLGGDATPEEIADFSRAVEFYVLPDHLWWGTWAVVQARYSPIDFDYLEYARLRLAGFGLHRRLFGFDVG